MSPDSRHRLWARLALATGLLLLILAIRYTDWTFVRAHASSILPAAAVAVAASGAWHLVRTLAWAVCFQTLPVSLSRLFRVRLAAEAVSYVTVRGVAGEPLKVLLLGPRHTTEATAAVALERLAYIGFTTALVGLAATAASLLLPLDPPWRRVFLAFAIGSALLVLTAVVLLRRVTRVAVVTSPVVRPPGHGSPIRAFFRSVQGHLAGVVAAGPRRFAVLGAVSLAGYLLMALEAWAVLRIGGWPISFAQALAIETLTRVTSMATAFIPGNLGALEVASLAASAAAGTPGGALLAVARRLRGLFWAAAGFAVFPKMPHTKSADTSRSSGSQGHEDVLLYVAEDPRIEVGPTARLVGLPLAERVVRAALAAGYTRIVVWAPESPLAGLQRLGPVTRARSADAWRRELAGMPDAATLTAIGPGTLVSPPLLRAAREIHPADDVRDVAAGARYPISGLVRVPVSFARDQERLASVLVSRVWCAEESPSAAEVSGGDARLSLRFPTAEALALARETLRLSVFKITDAKVARFNRRLSLPLSTALLPTPVTANAMSIFVCLLGFISGWLVSLGMYGAGVAGAALSLVASILDGCDGEIARLKYQESALGCWLETIGDYSYYIAMFTGLTIGAVRQTGWPFMGILGAAGLAGTLLSFMLLIYLRRTITEGKPETLHAVAKGRFKAEASWWTRVVWRVSFVATRAAMPYGILALALVNLLPVVVVLCAVGANIYWLALVVKLPALRGEQAGRPPTGDAAPWPRPEAVAGASVPPT